MVVPHTYTTRRKIKGRWHYFGKVADDPDGEAALEEWNRTKDDLFADRRPRPKGDGPAVADICSEFLEFREGLQDSGELAPWSYRRYFNNCELIVQTLGKERPVDDLRPDDFRKLREVMTSRWGPVAVANEIQMVRSAFKYAYDAVLVVQERVEHGTHFHQVMPVLARPRQATQFQP